MKIEILRSVMISGEPAAAGSIHEVSYSDAQLLIGMGKAKPAPVEEVEVEPAPVEVEAPRRGRKAAHSQPTED